MKKNMHGRLDMLDVTMPEPAENLAFDEVLFDLCEEDCLKGVLRFWEPRRPFVVIGYANDPETEVHMQRCRHEGIPVLRRCTGGGTVVQGPGCLNFTLILPLTYDRACAGITSTNTLCMERLAHALRPMLPGSTISVGGDADLTVDGRKVAGSAQRRGARSLLLHGVVLLSLRLNILEELLPMPSRTPAYRARRSHRDFVRNLNLTPDLVRTAVAAEWNATEGKMTIPYERIQRLARSKYTSDEWNLHRRLTSPSYNNKKG